MEYENLQLPEDGPYQQAKLTGRDYRHVEFQLTRTDHEWIFDEFDSLYVNSFVVFENPRECDGVAETAWVSKHARWNLTPGERPVLQGKFVEEPPFVTDNFGFIIVSEEWLDDLPKDHNPIERSPHY